MSLNCTLIRYPDDCISWSGRARAVPGTGEGCQRRGRLIDSTLSFGRIEALASTRNYDKEVNETQDDNVLLAMVSMAV